MKKNVSEHMLVAIVVLTLAVALPSLAAAKVSGPCGNCHTMHNSQDGEAMASTGDFGSTTPADEDPNGALLRYGCVGCHTGDNDGGDVPFVLASTAPTYGVAGEVDVDTLAGGNFWWVAKGDDSAGHNVLGVANQDATLLDDPPGGTAMTSQLTCAGTVGCHGDRSVDDQFGAVAGGHHGSGGEDNGYVSGSTADMSDAFRMLAGIEGIEDDDWEYTADVATGDHNLYKGASRTDETDDATTISSLCAQCHGDFHSGAGNVSSASWGSPWVRHPTDFDMSALATTSEYAGYTDYSLEAPVAVDTMDGTTDIGAIDYGGGKGGGTGSSIVTCVSCHRAHGSPHADLLRWDYTTMDAHNGTTGNTGCFNCHTTKDDA